jgi:sensor histidine kinase regulating citrate/malate metabolism
MADDPFKFAISLSVLNHLGRNLYRNFITVLGEAISNSWDADAKNVWVDIDWDAKRFLVVDDGAGMDAEAFQNRFLKIGYSKRTEIKLNGGVLS